ncbi:MAG: hypothetical protein EP343_14980 [Deltaproteobacteria bacterium]|nr:MAG: hypothetical protein EP343_14980 [Deltaproteobacteria bacterium]
MSKQDDTNVTRRSLLTWGAGLVATAAVTAALPACKKTTDGKKSALPFKWDGPPPPKGMTVADPNKGAGKALAYYVKTDQIDPKKEELFKKGRNCANCSFYQTVSGSTAWGRCTMLAMTLVTAEGWCKVWGPKAGTKTK